MSGSALVAAQPSAARHTTPVAHLTLAALTIAALFGALLVAPLPIWSAQPPRPPGPGAPPTEAVGWLGLLIPAAFLLAVCLPFRPYAQAQTLVRQARPRVVIALTALLALVAALMYPGYGSDIFDYVGFERMWVVYGDNPLFALPINHPQDWASLLVWYPDRTPAYGPLWALLTWPIVRLAGDSPLGDVIGYKVLSIAAYAGCCGLIWSTVTPERRKSALVMFAWSPLVLFEVIGKVHNDSLLALSLLALVWLVARARLEVLSLTAGVAGALVKATALAAAPPLLLYLWRSGGLRKAAFASLLALALVVALYAPFWEGLQTLAPIWNQTSRIVWSPASLLIELLSPPGGAAATTAVRAALVVLWLVVLALVLRRQQADLAVTIGWSLLATIFLLTSAVFSHYLVPAVALAAISSNQRFQRLVFWLSLGGLAAYAVELLSLTLGPDWIGSDGYRVAGSLLLLAPAAVVSLMSRNVAAQG